MRVNSEGFDNSTTSPSDYTIQLSKLPPNYTNEDITNTINNWWSFQQKSTEEEKNGFPIYKINVAYDIKEYT